MNLVVEVALALTRQNQRVNFALLLFQLCPAMDGARLAPATQEGV